MLIFATWFNRPAITVKSWTVVDFLVCALTFRGFTDLHTLYYIRNLKHRPSHSPWNYDNSLCYYGVANSVRTYGPLGLRNANL